MLLQFLHLGFFSSENCTQSVYAAVLLIDIGSKSGIQPG